MDGPLPPSQRFYLEHLLVGRVLAALPAQVFAHALQFSAKVDHPLDGGLAAATQLPLVLGRLHLCNSNRGSVSTIAGGGGGLCVGGREQNGSRLHPPMSASQSSGSVACLELPLRNPLEEDSVTPLVKWSTSMSTSLLRETETEGAAGNICMLTDANRRLLPPSGISGCVLTCLWSVGCGSR